MVTSVSKRNEWILTDLLGRSMGLIRATESGSFVVEPDGKARATMTGMHCGPFGSLDDALAAIETHTRGVCRRGGLAGPQPHPEDLAAGPDATETSTVVSMTDSPAPR